MKASTGMITLYMGRQFLIRFALLLTFFVVILQMLDLLNNSSAVLAPQGAGWGSVLKYISLRAPQIANQFTPFAALLAIVLTLSVLNHTSEITIMRAAGMSVHRVLFPLGLGCLVVASAHFVMQETLVVPATKQFSYWEANDYALDLPSDDDTRTNVRFEFDNEFIRAGSAARLGETVRLHNVTINRRDEQGLTSSILEAKSALYIDEQWLLFGVSDYDGNTLQVTKREDLNWQTGLNPELLFALSLDPDRTPLLVLVRKIAQLRRDGEDTTAATTSLLARFSKPLSTLVMPLLGAIAGFGVNRQGNQLKRAVIGAALGFGYFVFENLALALGKLGAMPAMLGAFFPFALFLVVGFAILMVMEN